MKRWTVPVLFAALLAGAPSFAQGAKKDAGVRRDPKGITGISPFWELVKKGDGLFVARDVEGALGVYREALAQEPQNAAGHYRVGQAQLAKGDLKEAGLAYDAALRYAGVNHALKAKVLFVLADLAERRKAHDEALSAWTKYEAFIKDQPRAQGHPQTVTERKARLNHYKKLATDSAAVKTRIEKRFQEADDRARKSAK
ncbi:MAG TPA: tetratricopeptide repeat protein [Polyangiaceae bacterium]